MNSANNIGHFKIDVSCGLVDFSNKMAPVISDDEASVVAGIRGVHKVFSHYMEVGELYIELEGMNPELLKYRTWLHERYSDVKDTMLELLLHPSYTLQELSLSTLMKFVAKEGNYPLKKLTGNQTYFPVTFFQRILSVLLSEEVNFQKLLTRFQEYVEYNDGRYYCLKYIMPLCQGKLKQGSCDMLLGNVFCLLEIISVPVVKNDEEPQPLSHFMSKLPDPSTKVCSVKEHKKLFMNIWAEFLKFKLPTTVYRRVLVLLHDKVMPHMNNPIFLTDFLTDSFNIGGAISLLALNGLFVLVHKYNLNYPDFYTKLYSLFEPSVFHVKYRSRFFHLCDLFLSSTHLPAYLVAAFIKKLARLCLTAPPSGLRIAVPFIYNLILRHPNCKQLVHRENSTDCTDDPYDPTEPDPAKCGAVDSCLWELKTLQHHFNHDIVMVCKKIDHALPEQEKPISELLDETDDSMFEKECSKKIKMAAVTFEPPKGLLGNRDDRLQLCWTL